MTLESTEILSFIIDNQRFAVPLSCVEHILPAQAITHVPAAPKYVSGVLDYHGVVVAVINLRVKFNLSHGELDINDKLVVINTQQRKLVLIVDDVIGIISAKENEINRANNVDSGIKFSNIYSGSEGVVLIYDIEKLLNSEDEVALQGLIEEYSSIS